MGLEGERRRKRYKKTGRVEDKIDQKSPGAWIRRFRHSLNAVNNNTSVKRHLTDTEMALYLQSLGMERVSKSLVSAWEKGKRIPDVEHLKILATASGTELQELIDLFYKAASPNNVLRKFIKDIALLQSNTVIQVVLEKKRGQPIRSTIERGSDLSDGNAISQFARRSSNSIAVVFNNDHSKDTPMFPPQITTTVSNCINLLLRDSSIELGLSYRVSSQRRGAIVTTEWGNITTQPAIIQKDAIHDFKKALTLPNTLQAKLVVRKK